MSNIERKERTFGMQMNANDAMAAASKALADRDVRREAVCEGLVGCEETDKKLIQGGFEISWAAKELSVKVNELANVIDVIEKRAAEFRIPCVSMDGGLPFEKNYKCGSNMGRTFEEQLFRLDDLIGALIAFEDALAV